MINARPLFLGISDDSFENFIKIVLLKRPSRRSQVWVDLSSNSKKTKKRNDDTPQTKHAFFAFLKPIKDVFFVFFCGKNTFFKPFLVD